METKGNKEDNGHSLLTIPEVAFFLRVHPNTVRHWSDRGLLNSYRINSRGDRRFKREEIQQFLNRLNHQVQWDILKDMEKVLVKANAFEEEPCY